MQCHSYIQEAFTCTCLKVHPHESHFMAQSNGDYIALFSTRKPYKLNKFKRYEGHKVMMSNDVKIEVKTELVLDLAPLESTAEQ